MSWKKNVFSYLMWFVFTAAVGVALAGSFVMLCTEAGMERYWGILFAVLFLAGAGGIVFVLHRAAPRLGDFAAENRRIFLAAEALWVVALFALGLILRMQSVNAAEQTSEYYEAAKIVEGQYIHRIVHGATYFYLQILHMALKLLGNRMMVGIWLQVICQFAAFLILYFVVRRLAGVVSALAALGFCICAPFMVRTAVVLSPEMLYFDLFMIAAALIAWFGMAGLRGKSYFLAGAFGALCFYIDISGILLLIFALSLIFCSRYGQERAGKKAAAFINCLGGAAAGFFAGIFLDASLSGKTVWRVAEAWGLLYQPEGFRWTAAERIFGSGMEVLILSGCMAFGIFSFWRNSCRERISPGVFALGVFLAAECFGIFSEGMPGYFYLYLLCILLAGVSLGQCFREKAFWKEEALQTVVNAEKAYAAGENAEETLLAEESVEIVHTAEENVEEALQADVNGEEAYAAEESVEEMHAAEENVEEVLQADVNGKEVYAAGENAEELLLAEANVEDVGETGFLDDDENDEFEEEASQPAKKVVQYIENPLPLPKKHVKRVLDYTLQTGTDDDDFDYAVDDDDDFDI